MHTRNTLGTFPCPLAVSVLLAIAASPASADPIPAQPIGFLAKHEKSSDPNDFFVIQGPARHGGFVNKIYFNARVSDLGENGEIRKWYVQQIEPSNDPSVRFFKIDKNAPAHPLGSFRLPAGARVESFIRTDNLGDARRPQYARMFFRVPGTGLFCTIGGGKPKKIRSESPTDSSKAIIGPAIRLTSYIFNNDDEELQGRLFFSGFDTRGGREPFISPGSAKGTKVLKNIYTDSHVGSDCGAFAALGPQNSSQRVFFTAKSPNDGNTQQLWQVLIQSNGRDVTYDAAAFTTGVNALPGAPANLIANGTDLFFTAPATGGGVPELWHLTSTGQLADLEVITTGGRDPQQLTFTTVDTSYSELTMSVLDSGVRRYARWSDFGGSSVTVIDGAAVGGFRDPSLITDAGQYFYFAADYDGDDVGGNDPTKYLVKHALGDNSVGFVNNGTHSGLLRFPFNIREICTVSAGGSGGTLYFVADAFIGNAVVENVLFKMPANDSGFFATPVLTTTSQMVIGAHNLRSVISQGGVGIFRLYFSAPINSTQNSEFLPEGSTDEGDEPWVTEEP
jgi:ELWxxDGT repeat protein